MYLTTKQVEALRDTGIDEKIEKFAKLFPNGTEVTYDLCITHPDIFSFGCPGARLLPSGWKDYWDKVLEAKDNYKMNMMINAPQFRQCISKEYPKQFFFNGVHIPLSAPVIHPAPMAHVPLERITLDYNLELALLFYETSLI